MKKTKSFTFSIIFWLLSIGIFVLVRFAGTNVNHVFLDSSLDIAVYWLLSSLIFGLVYWFILLFENFPSIRSLSYYKLIIFRVLLLMIATLAFTFSVFFYNVLLGFPFNEALSNYITWVFSPMMLSALVYVFASAIMISFIWQMTIKVGPSMLMNLLLGRYHAPIKEDRIFMFMDMKSSTTIAEEIGDIKYSKLIQECFSDLTESAILHEVEIYQYVGDEAILTWKLPIGVRDNHCVHVFFDFKRSLEQKRKQYQSKYGIFPEFKAGINLGNVVVAEVGVIKKEIAFLSDVLNTAARVQGKCNEHNAEILITQQVQKSLHEDKDLAITSIGSVELKGKQSEVSLYNVSHKWK